MIELKSVTSKHADGKTALADYSQVIQNGDFCVYGRKLGEQIIHTILGFMPVVDGYVCFDGMPFNEHSASFMRKMMAYIPVPEGFDNVADTAQKQMEMVEDALQSEAYIILAIDPTSHQTEETSRNIINALRNKADNKRIVIIASDNEIYHKNESE